MDGHRAPRLVILGGGITGLAAAYELVCLVRRERRKIEVVLLESSQRIGGKILTENRDGFTLEAGPDSFVTSKPHTLDLIRELNLSGELVKSNEKRRTVFIYSDGRLRPLPEGMLRGGGAFAFLRSDLLTWKAKFRAALEPYIPAALGDQDETVASFVRRRLGHEILEKVAGPMLAGIYAGDPDQLSLQSTFPHLKELERRGGILRYSELKAPGSNFSLFMTLKGGLSRLTEALALSLPPLTVRTGMAVSALRRSGGQWRIETERGPLTADAVIAALPANAMAQIFADYDFELSSVLREIPFVSTATISLAYENGGFSSALDGFGFLIPRSEKTAMTAATYVSTKFPGRVPAGHVLVRCFLGRAGNGDIAEVAEDFLAQQAEAELTEILRLGQKRAKIVRLHKWTKANPQYTLGHSLRLKRIQSCLKGHSGLFLAGCSYSGVGIGDCIRSGREAAAVAFESLRTGESLCLS